MNEQFQRAILEVAERLLHATITDDCLRSSLRLCAEEVLALTTEPVEPVPPPVEESILPVPVQESILQVGGEQPFVVATTLSNPGQAAEPFNQAVTQDRLILKAEAARWAAERPHRLDEGADLNLEIEPQDQEFIGRAQEYGCHLWMLDPKGRRPGIPEQFTLIAAWYENLAEALALLDVVIEESGWQVDEITDLLELAAESQSALRVAVGECGGFADEDQQAVFDWLRDVAEEHRIFIPVGMRLDNPTDPSQWAAITGRIQEVGRGFKERQAQARKRKKLLAKVRHKASVLTEAKANCGRCGANSWLLWMSLCRQVCRRATSNFGKHCCPSSTVCRPT